MTKTWIAIRWPQTWITIVCKPGMGSLYAIKCFPFKDLEGYSFMKISYMRQNWKKNIKLLKKSTKFMGSKHVSSLFL